MLSLLFFTTISGVISYIDVKTGLILDKIIFPSFIVLLVLKYFENTLAFENLIAIVIVLIIFVVPIILNMAFGGGDLRYGAFAALFIGLAPIGYFIMLSGIIHVMLLTILKKNSFPFAPAMSLGAIGAYLIGSL